jgi:hypothetical protein
VADDTTLTALISASRNLCQVIDNGLTTGVIKVEEGYEDMISGPVGVVRMITDQLPGGKYQWKGSLSEDEVKTEWVDTPGDERYQTSPTGCQLTHKPTGIVRQSFSMGNRERNKDVAWRSLEDAVAKRYTDLRV